MLAFLKSYFTPVGQSQVVGDDFDVLTSQGGWEAC